MLGGRGRCCEGAEDQLDSAVMSRSLLRAPAQSELQFPDDGRQSETARCVARGTRRMLRTLGYVTVTELVLADGRRADVVALGPDGTVVIVEIKSSVADYKADTKWRCYQAHCDRLYFAIPAAVPVALMPDEAGLIVADAYGAEIVRDAADSRMSPATRRSMFLRFAHAAADRLHRLADPEI